MLKFILKYNFSLWKSKPTLLYCRIPTFVSCIQQKAEPEAPEAYVLAFYQGNNSRELERNKGNRAVKENKYETALLSSLLLSTTDC